MIPVFINIGGMEFLLILLFALIPLALMIYCIVDLMRRNFKEKATDQILIFILLLCAPLIGSLIYLIVLRKNYALKK